MPMPAVMWRVSALLAVAAVAAAAAADASGSVAGEATDYAIVGAGPAGCQLGVFLQQAGLDYTILERASAVGSFYERFPRHGLLISINKRYTGRKDAEFNLRHDWNSLLGGSDASSPLMKDFSTKFYPAKEEFVKYMAAFAKHHALKVQFNRAVAKVRRVPNAAFAPTGLLLAQRNVSTTPAGFGPAVPKTLAADTQHDAANADGCAPWAAAAASSLRDKIAVVVRGGCSFVTKVTHAQGGGALAVIVVNSRPGVLRLSAAPDEAAAAEALRIPAVSVDASMRGSLACANALGGCSPSQPATLRATDRFEKLFELTDAAGGVLRARNLVIATSFDRPYVPQFPGVELAEGYEELNPEPTNFTDQRVLVLGLGNSAFETASALASEAAYVHILGRSTGGLRLASNTHYVGDVRAVNLGATDTFLLKSLDTIDVNFDLRNGSLSRNADGTISLRIPQGVAPNFNYREPYDRVIRCLGWRFDASMFDADTAPRMLGTEDQRTGKFPQMSSGFESSTPNMFFAGTLSHALDFKRSAGGFIHGFRYNIRALSRLLAQRNANVPWPARDIGADADSVARAFNDRVRSSSGLYQMFGVLADMVTIEKGRPAQYMEELPIDYILGVGCVPGSRAVTFHFDYGHGGHDGHADNSVVTIAPGQAHRSQFLHAIFRYFVCAKEGSLELKAEHHGLEDFLASWDVPAVHTEPTAAFLRRAFGGDYRDQEALLQEFAQRSKTALNATQLEAARLEGGYVVEDAYFGKVQLRPPFGRPVSTREL